MVLCCRHKSVIDYLLTNGLVESANALKQEANLLEFTQDPKAKWSGLLEKKWTSVIRLQKKVRFPSLTCFQPPPSHTSHAQRLLYPATTFIRSHTSLVTVVDSVSLLPQIMDLETRNAQLTEELAAAPTSKRPAAGDWLPRAPARHSLKGHRASVTKVAFHPVYSQLASASEDASIKVWDWDSGDNERTVKGHTKAVQDVDFDSKGNFLGELAELQAMRSRARY